MIDVPTTLGPARNIAGPPPSPSRSENVKPTKRQDQKSMSSKPAAARLRHAIESAFKPQIDRSDLEQVDADLANLLARIRLRGLAEANTELEELIELHRLLSTLQFRHRVDLSERQSRFVRMFDRWDDPDTIEFFHQEVVSGRLK
jgi:hypothetical protein